ncbi:hypothetical protein [Corallococcus exercitus]|uniref:hypothetical protein n=1 Tax=Corallococcus exercitus TaxID=2316736 RepID=UPI0035D4BC6D
MGIWVLATLSLASVSCSGGAHAQVSDTQPSATAVYLAQAQCGPNDSSISCCVKTHPGNPARCGATDLEAEDILLFARAAEELSRDLPEWKRICLETYVQCQEDHWTGSCYDCFRYCEGQRGEWPDDSCRPKRKRR